MTNHTGYKLIKMPNFVVNVNESLLFILRKLLFKHETFRTNNYELFANDLNSTIAVPRIHIYIAHIMLILPIMLYL